MWKFGITLVTASLLFAGCISATQSPIVADPPSKVDSPPGVELPNPATLRFNSEVSSQLLKSGLAYEAGLPFQSVGEHYGCLRFLPAWEYLGNTAYAMYRLTEPEYLHDPVIQTKWRYPAISNDSMWIGIGNYTTNAWDWQPLLQTTQYEAAFNPAHHVVDSQLLVAIVALESCQLEWLIAGEIAPPFVADVDPKLIMTGAEVNLTAEFEHTPGYYFEWDLGAGLSPSTSNVAQPLVTAGAPGTYDAQLTVHNLAGSVTHDFSYSISGVSEYPPLHLLALPDKTEVSVGEEVTITLITGGFPVEEPFTDAIIGLTFPDGVEYVADSLNVGAPGGEKLEVDGIWAKMSPLPEGFVPIPDVYVQILPTGIPDLVRLELGVAPVNPPGIVSGGEIMNIRLKFTEPGTYTLGFQQHYGSKKTYYITPDQEMVYWYDISNAAAPSIVVTP